MIRIPAGLLQQIAEAAEAAYPKECCGLVAGTGDGTDGFQVTRVVASANVASGDHADSFEVDPQVRFDLMRELGEIGDAPNSGERLIGHYHSHPDHPPVPSDRDLAAAYEPDMVWIIAAVDAGRVTALTAHRLDPARGRFAEIPLQSDDGASYADAPPNRS